MKNTLVEYGFTFVKLKFHSILWTPKTKEEKGPLKTKEERS